LLSGAAQWLPNEEALTRRTAGAREDDVTITEFVRFFVFGRGYVAGKIFFTHVTSTRGSGLLALHPSHAISFTSGTSPLGSQESAAESEQKPIYARNRRPECSGYRILS
jgi:hypothetical protein